LKYGKNSEVVTLSVVIPVYRSAMVLDELAKQIGDVIRGSKFADGFELFLVNDCSPDESWAVIERLATEHSFIRGVSLRKNAGQHNAIMAGLSFVGGDIVVVMDDDLQHPPTAIVELANTIQAGHDVCYTRYRGRRHVAWKQWGSQFNDWLATRLLKKPAGLYLSSFKALDRGIVDAVIRYDGPFTYLDGLVVASTNSITSLDIDHQDRFAGDGNYTLRKSISLWLRMVTGSSVVPLRVATILGFTLSAFSILMLIYVIVERLSDPSIPPGWTSTIATILLISGMQLICLGILGEYVGRIYARLNNTAQFVVGKKTF
jgi:polyisoprenyl-phosphate glycosyltransferase